MAGNVEVKSVESLRAFSSYLKNLSVNLTNEFDAARHAMYEVNEGWTDEENIRFMQEFEQSVEIINRIAVSMDDYGNFLRNKCDILDMYRNTRI